MPFCRVRTLAFLRPADKKLQIPVLICRSLNRRLIGGAN